MSSRRTNPIVRAASSFSERLEGRRLLSAGDPDAAFSGDGWATLSFPGAVFKILDTAVRADGKVVVAGNRGNNMAVARLNADGNIDTSFGIGGLFESGMRRGVTSVAVQGDGNIVLGLGSAADQDGLPQDLHVARVLADGSNFDASFGTNGIAHVGDRWGSSFIDDVVVQRDGKIVAAGWIVTGTVFSESDFAIVRYNANGTLDTPFGGGDGVSAHGFGDWELATALTIDYNGHLAINPLYGTIVVVGQNGISPSRFTLVRLRTDGTLDPSFSGDGKLISPDLSGAGREYATDVVVQPGGKIVVSGSAVTNDPNFSNFLVARYLSNGALDTSFGLGSGGVTELGLGGTRSEAESLVTGYVGGLLVGGSNHFNMAVLALTPNGRVDTRFSGDGILTTAVPGRKPGMYATGSLYAPIRKLVIAGGDGKVARYVDVGPVVTLGSIDVNAAEAGTDPGSFYVERDEAQPTPLRVFVSTGGSTATQPNTFPIRPRDYNGSTMPEGLVNFGNGQTSTTYVDIRADWPNTVVIITPVDDALVEGDEAAVFTVAPNAAYDISAPPSATLVIRDNDVVGGPVVMSSGFLFETAPQRVRFTFSQNVAASISDADFQITGPAGTPTHTFSYDAVTNTATLSFSAILPDGNYTVRAIASGITNAQGQPMPADSVLNFFFLQGDANRDGRVNLSDFNTLAANFGQSNRTFSQGDFSYDGIVNLADFNLLASRFGQSIAGAAHGSGGADGDDGSEAELRKRLGELLD